MSSGQPYDEERIVRQTDTHDEPTEVVRRVEVEREPAAAPTHYVREDVVTAPRAYVDDSRAVREDVAIDHVVARRAMLDRIASILWFFCGIIEIMLGLRVAFRLLEANANSGFVNFVYSFTDPFVRPFEGIFASPASDGAVLDSAALLAMVIYAILTWLIVRLIWLLLDKPETGARRSVSEYHRDRL